MGRAWRRRGSRQSRVRFSQPAIVGILDRVSGAYMYVPFLNVPDIVSGNTCADLLSGDERAARSPRQRFRGHSSAVLVCTYI